MQDISIEESGEVRFQGTLVPHLRAQRAEDGSGINVIVDSLSELVSEATFPGYVRLVAAAVACASGCSGWAHLRFQGMARHDERPAPQSPVSVAALTGCVLAGPPTGLDPQQVIAWCAEQRAACDKVLAAVPKESAERDIASTLRNRVGSLDITWDSFANCPWPSVNGAPRRAVFPSRTE